MYGQIFQKLNFTISIFIQKNNITIKNKIS